MMLMEKGQNGIERYLGGCSEHPPHFRIVCHRIFTHLGCLSGKLVIDLEDILPVLLGSFVHPTS